MAGQGVNWRGGGEGSARPLRKGRGAGCLSVISGRILILGVMAGLVPTIH